MTDTDPENEIGNGPTPSDRVIVTPHTNTCNNQVEQTTSHHARQSYRWKEQHPPEKRLPVLYDTRDALGDPVKRPVVGNQSLALEHIDRLGV